MSKKKGKGPAPSSKGLWFVVGGAVLAVVLLVAMSQMSARRNEGPAGPIVSTYKSDADLGAVRGAMGPADAKVVVIEYGDYL